MQAFSRDVLVGRTFTGEDLDGADFSEAELTRVVFEDCDLSGAELTSAVLDTCAFLGCRMERTRLRLRRAGVRPLRHQRDRALPARGPLQLRRH